MITENFHILLADDDQDDCMFFKDALEELKLSTELKIVHDGEQLMELLLKENGLLPHIIFLDLNMPRKNGFECLSEIKNNEKLKHFQVIIFSTSFDQSNVNLLHKNGAHHYIRKPVDFSSLKKMIQLALTLVSEENNSQPAKEHFVLSSKSSI